MISDGQHSTIDLRVMTDVFTMLTGKSTAFQMAVFKDLDMHLHHSARRELKRCRTLSSG